jgi:hypothetical protein
MPMDVVSDANELPLSNSAGLAEEVHEESAKLSAVKRKLHPLKTKTSVEGNSEAPRSTRGELLLK